MRDLYRKRARNYDRTQWLYRAAGFRVGWYRRQTIDALRLSLGDTVVDLACGSGLNFPLLYRAVGPTGRIVGVDLTDSMLQRAQARVEKESVTGATSSSTYSISEIVCNRSSSAKSAIITFVSRPPLFAKTITPALFSGINPTTAPCPGVRPR